MGKCEQRGGMRGGVGRRHLIWGLKAWELSKGGESGKDVWKKVFHME